MLDGLQVGGRVIYVDPHGYQREALVNAVWGDPKSSTPPCINLVYVHPNEDMQDSCGRQIFRESSVSYKTQNTAHGRYYMMPGDTPNPVAELQA